MPWGWRMPDLRNARNQEWQWKETRYGTFDVFLHYAGVEFEPLRAIHMGGGQEKIKSAGILMAAANILNTVMTTEWSVPEAKETHSFHWGAL